MTMIRSLHPDTVVFDEAECCAMERASTQEAHQELIREHLTSIRKVSSLYKESLLLGVFKYTVRLAFIPAVIHRTLYSALASAEKQILAQEQNQDLVLDCGHTPMQHCDALDAVCIKMAFPETIN